MPNGAGKIGTCSEVKTESQWEYLVTELYTLSQKTVKKRKQWEQGDLYIDWTNYFKMKGNLTFTQTVKSISCTQRRAQY